MTEKEFLTKPKSLSSSSSLAQRTEILIPMTDRDNADYEPVVFLNNESL